MAFLASKNTSCFEISQDCQVFHLHVCAADITGKSESRMVQALFIVAFKPKLTASFAPRKEINR